MEVPQKNYVGELQNQCQTAYNSLPEYLDESEGNNFKVTCKLNDWVCHGTGTSKRFAKQNAAKEMLVKIEYGKLLSPSTSKEKLNETKSSVSKLMEYCSKEKKDSPLFSDLPKDNNLFCCKCSLNGFSAVGKGNSKKEAKEKAAFEVAEYFDVHKYWDNFMKSKEQIVANLSSVQELNTFCQKKHLAVPSYEELQIKINNSVEYKVICSLGDLKVESPIVHSKKAAKCEAATLLLQSLKSDTPQSSPLHEDTKPAVRRLSFQTPPVTEDIKPSVKSLSSQTPPVKEDIKPVLKRKLSDSEEPLVERFKDLEDIFYDRI